MVLTELKGSWELVYCNSEATQQALNVKVGANAAEGPMGVKIWGNI